MLTETLTYTEISNDSANTAAVIVAGGSSQRMHGINKLFCPILGIPVIARTLLAYEECPSVGAVYIAARECDFADIQRICDEYCITKLKEITEGGSTRSQSVSNAVSRITGDYSYIAIADAARPLVTAKLIDSVIEQAMRFGAAVCAVPVTDTLKVADNCGFIEQTPDRSKLFAAQTPQVFRSDIYRNALAAACGDYTDDCALVEASGVKIKIVDGEYTNIKITVPTDIIIAEALLSEGKV